MSTNLVITCYSGDRTLLHPKMYEDRSYYIKKQFDNLFNVKHNLSQVTFVSNDIHTGNYIEYDNFLSNLQNYCGSTRIVVEHRPNEGMCYGAMDYVYKKYRDEFKYYITIEDDYIFCLDNFDLILENEIEKKPNIGFVNLLTSRGYPDKIHAAFHIGIIKTKALETIIKNEEFICKNFGSDYTANHGNQVEFGACFQRYGYLLEDTMDLYKTIFQGNNGELVDLNLVEGRPSLYDYKLVESIAT